jgi:methylated-DNA-[protein]-cysteine S-methyltransferase
MNGIGYYESPAGLLKITSVENGISEISFTTATEEPENHTPVVDQCIEELDEYFHRGRKFFSVELNLQGTVFQKKVWSELLTIPFGATVSYEELAIRIGDIKSIRAVGLANGMNPVAVIVPCHRVIGKNGDLTGYAGGLERKEWLLYHEGSLLKQLNLF